MAPKMVQVEDEYRKNEQLKKEDIELLQDWVKKQAHLPEVTELQLIWFLHSCYYSMEATKVTIDNFFTVRSHCPDLFGCPTEAEMKQALTFGFAGILPKKTPQGYAVQLCKLLDTTPENFDSILIIKLVNVAAMLHLYQNGTDVGMIGIIDMKGTSFGHLSRINLVALRKGLYHIQEASPVRIKALHFINLNPYTDMLVGLAKPFMNKEVLNLLAFHQNLESFYQHVPKDCLPEEYGGTASYTINGLVDAQRENMLVNQDLLKSLDLQKVDENKRAGKPKSVNEIFGVEGSFRKLDFD